MSGRVLLPRVSSGELNQGCAALGFPAAAGLFLLNVVWVATGTLTGDMDRASLRVGGGGLGQQSCYCHAVPCDRASSMEIKWSWITGAASSSLASHVSWILGLAVDYSTSCSSW